MFESLSERLGGVFDRLTKAGALSEADGEAVLATAQAAGAMSGAGLLILHTAAARVGAMPASNSERKYLIALPNGSTAPGA